MSVTHDDVTRAARTMVDVEPTPGLEARISARLDGVTPAAMPRRWPWVVGLATAAALALVVSQSAVRGPQSVSSSPQLPNSPSAQQPISSPVRLPAYRSMPESEREWMSRRMPAIDLIDLTQPEPLSITPLTMTPLMTSPTFGDDDEGRR